MGSIGKPIREIEVEPLEEPDPTFVPEEPPARERDPEPEKVPVEACHSMLVQ